MPHWGLSGLKREREWGGGNKKELSSPGEVGNTFPQLWSAVGAY